MYFYRYVSYTCSVLCEYGFNFKHKLPKFEGKPPALKNKSACYYSSLHLGKQQAEAQRKRKMEREKAERGNGIEKLIIAYSLFEN